MPVIDFVSNLTGLSQTVSLGIIITILIWGFAGGFWYILRFLSFSIDSMLVGFIKFMYDEIIVLIEGELFNDKLIDATLRNIYLFLGLIIFFRLGALLIKYILNPDLAADRRSGSDQIVKRVIMGMVGIVLTPLIFTFARDFQVAVIKDGIIQRIIIPSEMINNTSSLYKNGGGYLGVLTLSGFVSPSERASGINKIKYERSNARGMILYEINAGQPIIGVGNYYHYNYFPIISTIALGYLLHIMIYIALDLVVRFLNLFLYRMLSPIAFVEYMINGKEDGLFIRWYKGVLNTYFLLFIRVLSIWFFVFMMSLLGAGAGGEYTSGTLLQTAENDMLLKGLILIAILGFSKDLPKKIADLFGLQIEESSATGFLGKALSVAGGLAGAGLGIASAGVSGLGRGLGGLAEGVANKRNNRRSNRHKEIMSRLENQSKLDKKDRLKGFEHYDENRHKNVRPSDIRKMDRYLAAEEKAKKDSAIRSRLGLKEDAKVGFVQRAEDKVVQAKDAIFSDKKSGTAPKISTQGAKRSIFPKLLDDDKVREHYGLPSTHKVTLRERLSATVEAKIDKKLDLKAGNNKLQINADNVTKIMDGLKESDGFINAFKTVLNTTSKYTDMGKHVIKQTATQLFGLDTTTKAIFDSYQSIIDMDEGFDKKAKDKAKAAAAEAAESRFRSDISEQLDQSIKVQQNLEQKLNVQVQPTVTNQSTPPNTPPSPPSNTPPTP